MRARPTTLLAVALLWTTATAAACGTLTELMALHTQGVNHELGRGVERDYLAAANYYRAAAERGHADSGHDLAKLFDDGRGVRANAAHAYAWYRLAAEGGNTVAALDLRRLLARMSSDERAAGERVLIGLRHREECLR